MVFSCVLQGGALMHDTIVKERFATMQSDHYNVCVYFLLRQMLFTSGVRNQQCICTQCGKAIVAMYLHPGVCSIIANTRVIVGKNVIRTRGRIANVAIYTQVNLASWQTPG